MSTAKQKPETDAEILARVNAQMSTRRKRSRQTTAAEIRLQSPAWNAREARRDPP